MTRTPDDPKDQRPDKSDIETQRDDNWTPTASTRVPPAEPVRIASEFDPALIGNYRIIRRLGEGGMGIVYEAEQQHPRRLVALKVIRGGRFVDEEHIKLFEREVQALARLNHPGIASIYEAGRTSDGQHFFAMELVHGETLKEYLEKADSGGPLSPIQLRERLILFRQIAEAVTYAHQRSVIHRDLKPANIIVLRDSEAADLGSGTHMPKIKILDFGLARITETDLAMGSIGTEIGKIQGTLPYMSPEQARGNPDEIDVRSDVYSLGVILYEMIAGRRPYDVHNAMLHEAIRVICETPPVSLSESRSGIKKRDRDVETIVFKALEKSSVHRYQSVSALADDISRFLTGQPILARPPSTFYQLQKLAARHRVGFGAAAALAILIIVFAIVMSIQAERIARERDRANREATTAKQVSDFMKSLFRAPDPFRGKGKEVTARAMLDEGSTRVATELNDQPEVQTEIMLLMATSYYGLGTLDKATRLAQTALTVAGRRLGQDSLRKCDGLNLLGAIKMEQGDFAEAANYMREGLDIRRKVLGPDNILVAEDMNNIALLNFDKGDWKKAEEGLREALAIYQKALGGNNEQVATVLSNLGEVLKNQERFTEATQLYQESIAIKRNVLGPNHPLIASSLNNLGMLYVRQKKYGDADRFLQEALAIDRKALGESHLEVGRILSCLGGLNLDRGRWSQAEDYYRQSINIEIRNLGENNPDLAGGFQNLGVVLAKQNKFTESEECLHKAVSLKLKQFAPNHWEIATTNNLLGECLVHQRKYKDAEPLLIESYTIIKKQFGLQHGRTQRAASRLIALYEASGRKDKATAVREELKGKE